MGEPPVYLLEPRNASGKEGAQGQLSPPPAADTLPRVQAQGGSGSPKLQEHLGHSFLPARPWLPWFELVFGVKYLRPGSRLNGRSPALGAA